MFHAQSGWIFYFGNTQYIKEWRKTQTDDYVEGSARPALWREQHESREALCGSQINTFRTCWLQQDGLVFSYWPTPFFQLRQRQEVQMSHSWRCEISSSVACPLMTNEKLSRMTFPLLSERSPSFWENTVRLVWTGTDEALTEDVFDMLRVAIHYFSIMLTMLTFRIDLKNVSIK